MILSSSLYHKSNPMGQRIDNKRYHYIYWLGSIALLLAWAVHAEPRPGSLNVCNKTITIIKTVKVPGEITFEREVPTKCAGILGCTKREKVTRPSENHEQRAFNETRLACCDGYTENQSGDCLPVCSNACIHGDCIKPEVCACHLNPSQGAPGWSGPTCNRFVCENPDRWGKNCESFCNCSPNGFCHAETGDCLCKLGWGGINCSEQCSSLTDCKASNTIQGLSRAATLQLASPAEIVADPPESSDSSTSRAIVAHIGINLIVTIVGLIFLYGLLTYRRKWKAVKDELYYVTYTASSNSASSSSGSSPFDNPVYSLNNESGSSYNDGNSRPPLPEPNHQFPGKEESYYSAARNSPTKGMAPGSSRGTDSSQSYLVNPKIEKSLLNSKKDAKANLYSDSSEANSCILEVAPSTTAAAPSSSRVSRSPSLALPNNDYQVPRSPVRISPIIRDNDNANIYEEIRPDSIYTGDS